CAGSNTIEEPRFVICCVPAPGQSCFQLVPPSVLDQSPCFATVVTSMSKLGCDARYDVLPHSEGIPARFAVTLTHVAGGVAPPPPVVPAAPPVASAPATPPLPPMPPAEEQAIRRTMQSAPRR